LNQEYAVLGEMTFTEEVRKFSFTITKKKNILKYIQIENAYFKL